MAPPPPSSWSSKVPKRWPGFLGGLGLVEGYLGLGLGLGLVVGVFGFVAGFGVVFFLLALLGLFGACIAFVGFTFQVKDTP